MSATPNMTHAKMLEGNIDRVVETVLRGWDLRMVAPLADVAGPDGTADLTPQDQEAVRTQVTDLCGHVAVALRGLDPHGHNLATYVRPAPKAPTLDVKR